MFIKLYNNNELADLNKNTISQIIPYSRTLSIRKWRTATVAGAERESRGASAERWRIRVGYDNIRLSTNDLAEFSVENVTRDGKTANEMTHLRAFNQGARRANEKPRV